MQMNEQVLTALEVLRNFAENDFERHRIDVLEKDLTAPPQVEVIDGTHQKFNGIIYKRLNEGHYLYGSSVHRAVYSYYFGEIPEDYHIHHIDENKSNNDISNLQLLTSSEHRAIHNSKVKHPDKICPTCGKSFHPHHTINLYCSKECFEKSRTRLNKICPQCGKEFSPTQAKQIYCSKNCASKVNGLKGKTPISQRAKKCPVCGKVFAKKNPKTVCCSRACGRKLGWQKRTDKVPNKVCPVCGKSFFTYHKEQVCCSHSCARKNK